MKKIILLLTLLFFLVGCTQSQSEVPGILEDVDDLINEDKKILESEEIKTPEPEKIKTISLLDFTNKIFKKVYPSSNLRVEPIYTHELDHIESSNYDIYDSSLALGIFLKEGFYINSLEDFRVFANSYSENIFRNYEQDIMDANITDYEFVQDYKLEGTLYPEIMKYMRWTKTYKIISGSHYTTKKLDRPMGQGFVIVNCAPNLVLFVYPNSYNDFGLVWSNLEEEEYMENVMSALKNYQNDAFQEAEELLQFCKETLNYG